MKICFEYDRETYTREPIVTRCLIYADSNDSKAIAVGEAECHEDDRCVKDIGRKIALARALKNGGFSYAERAEMWKKYLTRDLK